MEASRKLPGKEIRLETADNTYYFFKSDIFKGEITYSTDKHVPANLVTLTAAEAWNVVKLNKNGEKPLSLKEETEKEKKPSEYADILGQDSLTRFDKKKKKRKGNGNQQDKKARQQQPDAEQKAAKGEQKEPKEPKAEQHPERKQGENRPRNNRRNDRRPNNKPPKPTPPES